MNDPHFTGRLVAMESMAYTVKSGETHHQVNLKLRSVERTPQTLLLKLKGQMAEDLLSHNPEVGNNTVVTAYLEFSTYVYTEGETSREVQETRAWRLEFTHRITGELFT